MPAIAITVQPLYLPDQSDPASNRYVYAYTITIRNEGEEPVQLLYRHWRIEDGEGRVQEVVGRGVVGETPVIAPGESFEYTSGTLLESPFGTMQGSYDMVTAAGEPFSTPIPAFTLAPPHSLH